MKLRWTRPADHILVGTLRDIHVVNYADPDALEDDHFDDLFWQGFVDTGEKRWHLSSRVELFSGDRVVLASSDLCTASVVPNYIYSAQAGAIVSSNSFHGCWGGLFVLLLSTLLFVLSSAAISTLLPPSLLSGLLIFLCFPLWLLAVTHGVLQLAHWQKRRHRPSRLEQECQRLIEEKYGSTATQ